MITIRNDPAGYSQLCAVFLQIPDDELDRGYSLALKRERPGETGASATRRCGRCQKKIKVSTKCSIRCFANGLDAERNHHQDSAPGHAKARWLAVASRNHDLHQYYVESELIFACRMREAEKAPSLKRRNIWSVARQKWPDLVPRPRCCRFGDDPLRNGALSSTLLHEGDKEAARSLVEENRADLEAEVAARREEAAHLNRVANAACAPVAQRDWLEWLDKSDDYFRQCLRKAPVASRCLAAGRGRGEAPVLWTA